MSMRADRQSSKIWGSWAWPLLLACELALLRSSGCTGIGFDDKPSRNHDQLAIRKTIECNAHVSIDQRLRVLYSQTKALEVAKKHGHGPLLERLKGLDIILNCLKEDVAGKLQVETTTSLVGGGSMMKGEGPPASDRFQHDSSTEGGDSGGGSLKHHFNGNIPCLDSMSVGESKPTDKGNSKVLAVVIASTRGGHLTFPCFKMHLLDPLRADLALAVAVAPPGNGPDLFRDHAKYLWEVDEPPKTAGSPPERIKDPNYRYVTEDKRLFAPCLRNNPSTIHADLV